MKLKESFLQGRQCAESGTLVKTLTKFILHIIIYPVLKMLNGTNFRFREVTDVTAMAAMFCWFFGARREFNFCGGHIKHRRELSWC